MEPDRNFSCERPITTDTLRILIIVALQSVLINRNNLVISSGTIVGKSLFSSGKINMNMVTRHWCCKHTDCQACEFSSRWKKKCQQSFLQVFHIGSIWIPWPAFRQNELHVPSCTCFYPKPMTEILRLLDILWYHTPRKITFITAYNFLVHLGQFPQASR